MNNLELLEQKRQEFDDDQIEVFFYSSNHDNIICKFLSEFEGELLEQKMFDISMHGEVSYVILPNDEKIYI